MTQEELKYLFAEPIWKEKISPMLGGWLQEVMHSLIKCRDYDDMVYLQCKAAILKQLIEDPEKATSRIEFQRSIKKGEPAVESRQLRGPSGYRRN